MKKAIEVFPVSEEEAEDIDKLKDTFPDKADLRAVLEDYFHIHDDYAKMSAQEFDMYFEDYMKDYEKPEFVEDMALESSRKQIKSSVEMMPIESFGKLEIYEDKHGYYCQFSLISDNNEENVIAKVYPDNEVVLIEDGREGTFEIDSEKAAELLNTSVSEIERIKTDAAEYAYELDEDGYFSENGPNYVPATMKEQDIDDRIHDRSYNEMFSSRKPVTSGRVELYRDAYLGGLMSREDFKKNLLEEGYDDELADYLIDKMCGNSITCSKKTVVESLIKSGYSKKEAEDIYAKSRV